MGIADLNFDSLPDAQDKRKKRVPAMDLSFDDLPTIRGPGVELARQGGLTARYAVEGPLGAAAAIVGDPAATAVNWGVRGVNALGANIPEMGMPSQALPKMLDRVFPQPETPTEHVVGAISKGISGTAPFVGAAQLAPAAMRAASPMLQSMVAAPTAELASAGIGGGASETTKQMGGGTGAQLIAGAVAPMAAGGIYNTARHAGETVNELRRPLTKGGAEQIAADTIGRLTSDKGKALENLQRYNALKEGPAPVGVPGSRPNAGEVAADYGLIGGQQAISRGDAAPLFAARQGENNAARLTDLSKLNATEKAVEGYKAKRETLTKALRDEAFDNATGPVDFGPVAYKIGEVAGTAAGGRVESQKALAFIAERLEKYQQAGRTDPRNAYALHQDIGDLIAGKVRDSNGAPIRLAGGLANDVKKTLATQIEAVTPGFKKYMEHYSRLSKPIDRLEAITDRLGGADLTRVTNATPVLGADGAAFTLSQAKMRNALSDIKGETNLAPRQRDVLERVLGDLNAETLAARGGKQPGSDTYQNMASANFVNRMLGGTLAESGIGRAIQGPLGLVSKPFESRINDLVVNAFQDPKEMERLLRKARTQRGNPTLSGLFEYSAPRLTGGLFGSIIQ